MLRKEALELVQVQRRVMSTVKCVTISRRGNDCASWGFLVWKRNDLAEKDRKIMNGTEKLEFNPRAMPPSESKKILSEICHCLLHIIPKIAGGSSLWTPLQQVVLCWHQNIPMRL